MQTLAYTTTTLEKLEAILKTLNYTIRYEKGNFNTGMCLIENNKTIVVNKFSGLDAKINSLVNFIKSTNIPEDAISDEKLKKVLLILQQTTMQF